MGAQVHLPVPRFSRLRGFCWMEVTLLCVKKKTVDLTPTPQLGALGRKRETCSLGLRAVLSVSSFPGGEG